MSVETLGECSYTRQGSSDSDDTLFEFKRVGSNEWRLSALKEQY
jgi:hypothetical protein